jgi:hypothetical protein
MPDDAVTRVVADSLAGLEKLPTEGAWVTLTTDDPGHSVSIRGNARGLASLSRVLLQKALDSDQARECSPTAETVVGLDGVYVPSHQYPRLSVHLQEHPPPDETETLHSLGLWRAGLLLFIVGFVLVMGADLAVRVLLRRF